MKIRESKISDIEGLVKLWKKTNLYFASFDDEKRLEEKISKEPSLLLVAEADECIVGVVIGNYGWRVSIDHLAVDPEYQKQGIGRKLFEEIKKRLKEKGATTALIDSNLSIQLLQRAGCKYRGTYSNYTIEL